MLKPLGLSSSISGIEVTGADQISGREVAWSDESGRADGSVNGRIGSADCRNHGCWV